MAGLLNRHENETVQERILIALQTIASHAVGREEILKQQDLLEKFKDLLNSDSTEIRFKIAAVIENLARSFTGKYQFWFSNIRYKLIISVVLLILNILFSCLCFNKARFYTVAARPGDQGWKTDSYVAFAVFGNIICAHFWSGVGLSLRRSWKDGK